MKLTLAISALLTLGIAFTALAKDAKTPATATYEYQGRQVTLPTSQVFDLTGHVASAQAVMSPYPAVQVTLRPEAGDRLRRFTARNVGNQCGFVLNARLIQTAIVRSEIGPRFEISGLSSTDEAVRLASELTR